VKIYFDVDFIGHSPDLAGVLAVLTATNQPKSFARIVHDVYQEAIAFCGWVGEFLNSISAKAAAKDQLDRASTSIPLNIAEGNGKFSAKDRARFLEMARGSALECAACLDVLLVRKLASEEQVILAKQRLSRIVQMLIALLRKFSERAGVLREEEPAYPIEHDHEHEQEHD